LWLAATTTKDKIKLKQKTITAGCGLCPQMTIVGKAHNLRLLCAYKLKLVYGFFVVLVKAHSPKPFFVMAYGHSPEKTKKSLSSAAFLRLPLLWDPPTAHNRMLLWPMRGARIFLLLWPTATTTYGYGRSPETKGVA
jgi:hypothetical protein